MTDEFSHSSSATNVLAPAAADAADFQLAEKPSVIWHPSAALFQQLVALIIPIIPESAQAKNVPLEDSEIARVANYSVCQISRRAMRRVLNNDAKAIAQLQRALNHSLDIICVTKYIARVWVDQGYPEPDMNDACRLATHLLRDNLANDRALIIHKWPDMDVMVRNFLMDAAAGASQIKTFPLSENALRRCVVRMPVSKGTAGTSS